MKLTKKISVLLVFVFFYTLNPIPCTLSAAVPHLINYQGRLTDAEGVPLNGSYNFVFRIYDAETAGNLLWQGTHDSVSVTKGIFSVLLGDKNDTGYDFSTLTFDKAYFLEIKVGEEVMSPRERITSAGYAIRADIVEYAEKIKTDSGDNSPGYLSDKTDNTGIKVNTSTHKLYAVHGIQIFTASGTFTAPADITKIYITMCGAGGGGGYSTLADWGSSGGGAGGCIIHYPYVVSPGNSYAVTIGAGGSGGTASVQTGGSGGSTSFDTISLPGGSGGQSSHNPGGAGGGGLDGGEYLGIATSIKGGNGGTSISGHGGAGGSTPLGRGAPGRAISNPQPGVNASANTGGGGGGATGYGNKGGNGGSGICIIEW